MPYQITFYIFIHKLSTSSPSIKQCKRKFKKLHRINDISFYKYTDNKNLVTFLLDFIKKHPHEPIGFISEDAKIIQNITLLPDIPGLDTKTFSDNENNNVPNVFCLHSNVTKIIKNTKYENDYWNSITCDLSLNFILATGFVNTFVKNIDKSLEFENTRLLFGYFSTLFTNTVGVTQYNFTHDSNLHTDISDVYFSKINDHEKQKVLDAYHSNSSDKLDTLTFEKLEPGNVSSQLQLLDTQTRYKYTPKITVVMTLTDINQFFVTLHSFMKQDYPRDKIELYILDEFKLDTKLKHLLPAESRIRFINLETKNNKKVPLGYKINAGFKYASNDIVAVMLDTHYYNSDYITQNVYKLLDSSKECTVSQKYNLSDNNIHTQGSWDIGSIVCTKKMWNNYSFQELEDNQDVLMLDFFRYRHSICTESEFGCFSFCKTKGTGTGTRTPCNAEPLAIESISVYNNCKM